MKRLSLTMAALVPVILAGCNGSDLSEGGSPSTSGLTSENSNDVGHAIAAAVAGGGGGSASGASNASGSGASFTEDEGDDCWVVSGDESDADGDDIPANALYTLTDCTWTEEGWTVTYDGTESVSDPHPDVADYAYADSYDLTVAFSDGAGNEENDHYVGSDEASEENGTYTFHGALAVDFAGVHDGQSYSGHYAEDLTWTFAFTSETSGIETVNGSWSQTLDGESVSVTLETTDPLVIDASCESGIVAGTVVATSGDATETITWTGCDEYSLAYDGT